MPLVPEQESSLGNISTVNVAPKVEAPGFIDTVGAAFRVENSAISALANGSFITDTFEPEDGYDPFVNIAGYEDFAQSFVESNSAAETTHIKSRIDKQIDDRNTLQAGGTGAIVAQIAAGITDPIFLPLMLIPGSAFFRAGRVAQTAGRFAASGGVAEAAAEGAKHLSQDVRTMEESLINIAGATVLSGVMGGATAALTRQEFDALADTVTNVLHDPEAEFGPRSAGAQAVRATTLEQEAPVSAGGLEKIGVTPELRTANSPSIVVRRLLQDLTDSSVVLEKNTQGIASGRVGGSVENRTKQWVANLGQATEQADSLYLQYRQSTSKYGTVLSDLVRGRKGKMSRGEFNVQVGRALRRGDVSDIPEVEAAATSYREKLFNPLKDRAIEAGLLPADVTVEGAVSYFTRVYNVDKIKSQTNEFNKVLTDWLHTEKANIALNLDKATGELDEATKSLPSIQEASTKATQEYAALQKQQKQAAQKVDRLRSNLRAVQAAENELSIEMQALLNRYQGTEVGKVRELIKKFEQDPGSLSIADEKLLSRIGGTSIAKAGELAVNITRVRNRLSKARDKSSTASNLLSEAEVQNNLAGKSLKGLNAQRQAAGRAARKALAQAEKLGKRKTDLEVLSVADDEMLESMAADITNNILLSSSTRISYAGDDFTKGVFKERTLTIADELIEDFLESDVDIIARQYQRTMAPDVELADAFGSPGMKDQIDAVTDNYKNLISAVAERTKPKVLKGVVPKKPKNGISKEEFSKAEAEAGTKTSRTVLEKDGESVEILTVDGKVVGVNEISKSVPGVAAELTPRQADKLVLKLQNRQKSDIQDIQAMRDRLRGTYGIPTDPDNFFVRAGRAIRDFNFVRMMGGVVLSSIPDIARPIASNGLRPVAKSVMQLVSSPKRFKLARQEAKLAGAGWEMVTNARLASRAELTDIYGRNTKFERGLRAISDAFGKISLITPWNAALKQWAGLVTSHRILEQVAKVADGTISKSMRTRLAQGGIDNTNEMAERIAQQFKKFGDADGDIFLPQSYLWADKEAAEVFKAAVLKDVEATIVTPGVGDRPLWMSTEMGKMVGQFKSFSFTSNQKILVSGLQYRDAAALNGLLLTLAMGSLSYGSKQLVAGKEISTDPSKVLVEAIDRSGVTGYLMDVNNIVEKMLDGSVGINAIAGNEPMSRYASRNIIAAMFGPTVGTIEDVRKVTSSVTTGEFSRSDVRAMRKMLPMQNLFYWQKLLDSLEEETAQALGVTK